MVRSTYIIALGSNQRGRHGGPGDEVRAALALLDPVAAAPIVASAPVGPSLRRFANSAALVENDREPLAMLAWLKVIEHEFGRRSGQRWGARVIDLDLIGWSGGSWSSPGLIIPHPAFRERRFVLDPLLRLVPDWRDPVSGLTVRQLHARLTRRAPVPTRPMP